MASPSRLKVCLPRAEIEAAVGRLAAEISRDYRDRHPLLLGVLKGSFVFLADLVRRLDFPLDVDFVRLTSYGPGTASSGKVELTQPPGFPLRGRDVVIVEDIVDSGLTTSFLLEYLGKQAPASLRLCALTDKPARRTVPVKIDYLGFTVPDKFLVGYGLDHNERFRNLPDICYLEEEA